MTGAGFSCGACKFLRRRCTNECVFTPYFCYSQGADHFAAVHKIFGASNVSKLLMKLPLQDRSEAALSLSYEALARMHDPVYGCVAQIFALEQQVAGLQEEIDQLMNYMHYASFGLQNDASFQEITNINTGLVLPSQFENKSINDHLNQQTAPFFFEPQVSPGQISFSYNSLDHLQMENGCSLLNTKYQSF
ncbi:hypothetical protein L2E82_22414 [Cichorium intybus]|uniref:Uncharacterized protein n=1 Tax=Cichorium intybus TaxID=13427 RepID=A0ACB9DXQ3_CICIN|nr:hypothetical protein L2E82_22414 [Cichorium intybus]